jgi:glycosyltransferase involved in cell wall biosynthesis
VNRISIITICFNNPEDLQATCASVNMQKTLPFEHIIIDGSTTSEIKNWLESTAQPIYRKWICEKDDGISDAFNKGLKKATGHIINFLNSGDILFDENALNKIHEVFETNPDIGWCHGKLLLQRGGQWVSIGKPFDPEKLYRGMRGVSHPVHLIYK